MSRAISFFVSGLLLGVLLAGFGFVAYVNQSAGLGAGEGQTVLKLGHSLDTGHPVHVEMEFMGDRLAELSGGSVRLDIYPNVPAIIRCRSGTARAGVLWQPLKTTISAAGFIGSIR